MALQSNFEEPSLVKLERLKRRLSGIGVDICGVWLIVAYAFHYVKMNYALVILCAQIEEARMQGRLEQCASI